MERISLEVNPEVVERFQEFGKLLIELGDLIEEMNGLMSKSEKVVYSIQQLTQDISTDLAVPQGIASTNTRRLAAHQAAAAAATMFFMVSQVPGLMGLMEDLSKMKDFASLSGLDREALAIRLRQEGKALSEVSLLRTTKAGGSKSTKRAK